MDIPKLKVFGIGGIDIDDPFETKIFQGHFDEWGDCIVEDHLPYESVDLEVNLDLRVGRLLGRMQKMELAKSAHHYKKLIHMLFEGLTELIDFSGFHFTFTVKTSEGFHHRSNRCLQVCDEFDRRTHTLGLLQRQDHLLYLKFL